MISDDGVQHIIRLTKRTLFGRMKYMLKNWKIVRRVNWRIIWVILKG